MIFARCVRAEKGAGLTVGRIYIANPEFDMSDVTSFRSIEVMSDTGEKIKVVLPSAEERDGGVSPLCDFEFLEEVYAVVTKKLPSDEFKIGQVVVVEDVEFFQPDGTWSRLVYEVKGFGFRSSHCLVLLDHTNVMPGMTLKREATGGWVKVRAVDECLWVMLEGETQGRHSPEEFLFGVDSDGDILISPVMECIMGDGKSLTTGNLYYPLRDGQNGCVVVVNDNGEEAEYLTSRFKNNV